VPTPSVAKRSQAADRARPQELDELPVDSWDNAWSQWIEEKKSEQCAAKTLINFAWGKGWIDHFRHDPVNRIVSPPDWTARQTTEFTLWLTEGGELAPSSVNKVVNTCLIQFLGWCASDAREGELPWKVSRKPDYRKIRDDRPNRDAYPKLNEMEMRLALDSAKLPRDRFLLAFLATAGLRVGEVGAAHAGEEANLKIADMALNSASGKWELKVWTLKPPRRERQVPVDRRLKLLWDSYTASTRPKIGIGINPETGKPWQAVFLTNRRDGDGLVPMTVSALQQVLKGIQHGAPPVPRLHPHILRHTFGRAMAHVVMPFPLAAMMGHKDVRTTMLYASLEGLDRGEFQPHSQIQFAWLDEEVARLRPRSSRAMPAIRKPAAVPTG